MLTIGAATKVINNELGTRIQGATVNQVAKSIRDDLEANALYLSDGSLELLLVSCDIGVVIPSVTIPTREAMAQAAGIPARNVIIAGTHTHAGPSVVDTCYGKGLDTAYLERLQGWLVELAQEAKAAAQPARVGWGAGAARIGYNRRCCWADGSHSMHGDTTRPDFTGLEGPDDPSQVAIFAQDADGKMLAVLHNNTSHPTCFYGADFYSADFPGAARQCLRDALGPIPVLFFNGAFGDIALESQLADRSYREEREQKMMRAAHLLAGETLRLLHEATWCDEPALGHAYDDLEIPVRLPAAERLDWARSVLARVDAGEDVKAWDTLFAHGATLLQNEFGERGADTVAVHGVRIGDVGIATQPCELFCQFGLDIKRRSPAPITAVFGIADGYGGYCPTAAGPLGGGYSGEAIHWCRLAADGGYRITDAAARLLHELWR